MADSNRPGLLARISKPLIRRIVGDSVAGASDFLRFPEERDLWGGPFNGQRYRLRIFADLMHHCAISAIVETGTFRGTTTMLFAGLALPVYSAEIDARNYGFAKARLFMARSHVHVSRSDSVAFLRRLSTDPAVPREHVFFYLDAHWMNHLPLREELAIVFSSWKRPIVMIDDFCVPGSAYDFDSYGPDKTLNLDYVAPVMTAHGLAAFFPVADASEETGRRRGCVVLCDEQSGRELDRVTTLKRASL